LKLPSGIMKTSWSLACMTGVMLPERLMGSPGRYTGLERVMYTCHSPGDSPHAAKKGRAVAEATMRKDTARRLALAFDR